MKELNKKIVVLILVTTFVFSPIFAIPARAQWVVFDPANFVNTTMTQVKEYGLDALAWMLINQVINRMTASTVKWINSGFHGSPAYITDPAAYYSDLGNKMAGQFIYNNPNLNFLCGDMSVKVKLALSRSYNYNDDDIHWKCSLTEVVDNLDDFMNDFERGGWEGFFELTQRQQNNPIGIYIQASDAMYDAIENTSQLKREELSQGKGFFGQKQCLKWAPGVESVDYQTGEVIPGEPVCVKEETVTPGDVISDQLNKQLGLGNDRLAISDEINELVSSLLNQLFSQVMGGIRGLRGASESNSSNNNKVLTEQLGTETAEEKLDYFRNTQNTEILNTPVPDPYCMDQSDDPIAPNYVKPENVVPGQCQNRREESLSWPPPTTP